MSDDIAIKVDGVSKSFRLPHEKSGSIKGALVGWRQRKRGYENQHVLKDISFEIKKGEFFGIVGRNGSGKSTLLKLISQIYTPDKGTIQVNGKLTPFIELGVGFNPELSGRDNVYLNGALLGFSREEMEAMYDEIVAFAELERFMDQKLKNYSSGMQVRLAFSIAIRADSDILVLDEVLAVGDEAFQRKCLTYFESLKQKRQTVILVTHSMTTVERFCSKALFLKDGEVRHVGTAADVSASYSIDNQPPTGARQSLVELDDVRIELLNRVGQPDNSITVGDTVEIGITWHGLGVANAGIALYSASGMRVFATNTFEADTPSDIKSKRGVVYAFAADVAPGEYFVRIRLFGETEEDVKLLIEKGPEFTIAPNSKRLVDGQVFLRHSWRGYDMKESTRRDRSRA